MDQAIAIFNWTQSYGWTQFTAITSPEKVAGKKPDLGFPLTTDFDVFWRVALEEDSNTQVVARMIYEDEYDVEAYVGSTNDGGSRLYLAFLTSDKCSEVLRIAKYVAKRECH